VIERYEITSVNVSLHAKVLMMFGQRKTSLPPSKRDFQSAEAVYRKCLQICNKNPLSREYMYAPALLELGFVLQQRSKALFENFGENYLPAITKQDECRRILAEAEFLLEKEDDNYVKHYNLACLASIKEDEKECQKILSRLEEEGHMANLQLICRDTNFDNVRNKDWFKDFVNKHFSSADEENVEDNNNGESVSNSSVLLDSQHTLSTPDMPLGRWTHS